MSKINCDLIEKRMAITNQFCPVNTIKYVVLNRFFSQTDLEAALAFLQERHLKLRCTFLAKEERFMETSQTINCIRLTTEEKTESICRELLTQDILKEGMIHASLYYQYAGEQTFLFFLMNHLICDGQSFIQLIHEFLAFLLNLPLPASLDNQLYHIGETINIKEHSIPKTDKITEASCALSTGTKEIVINQARTQKIIRIANAARLTKHQLLSSLYMFAFQAIFSHANYRCPVDLRKIFKIPNTILSPYISYLEIPDVETSAFDVISWAHWLKEKIQIEVKIKHSPMKHLEEYNYLVKQGVAGDLHRFSIWTQPTLNVVVFDIDAYSTSPFSLTHIDNQKQNTPWDKKIFKLLKVWCGFMVMHYHCAKAPALYTTSSFLNGQIWLGLSYPFPLVSKEQMDVFEQTCFELLDSLDEK